MAIRLGLDASQPYASCAVSTDLGIAASLSIEKPIENFPALIRNTLSRAQVSLEEIDEIVVCIGPGSQTGVRSAVVTGNALAFALDKPITGVLTTDAAAVLSPIVQAGSVAVSAGRRRLYVEKYRWEGQKLCRLDEMQLMDEMPPDAFSVFNASVANAASAADAEAHKTCAYGILVVAKEQRHLIEQSLCSEIRPYEKGADCQLV